MKVPELKIIYWLLGISLLLNVLAVIGSEQGAERIGFILGALFLLTILFGLKERSDSVRKIAIYYFGFVLFVSAVILILVTPYTILFTEDSVDLLYLFERLFAAATSIFIIRALVNEPLLSEFLPNEALENDTD